MRIKAGDPIDEFLRQFATVGREQAVAGLDLADWAVQAALMAGAA